MAEFPELRKQRRRDYYIYWLRQMQRTSLYARLFHPRATPMSWLEIVEEVGHHPCTCSSTTSTDDVMLLWSRAVFPRGRGIYTVTRSISFDSIPIGLTLSGGTRIGYAESHRQNRIKAEILIWWEGGTVRTIGPGVSKDMTLTNNKSINWGNSLPLRQNFSIPTPNIVW